MKTVKREKNIVVALILAIFSMMSLLCVSAADADVTTITNGETVYGAAGWKLPQNYTISVYSEGNMVMDLKTPSAIDIRVWDENGKEIPPFDYQAQTKYGSHVGFGLGGYYLSYGNTTTTKTAHGIFQYKVSPGNYSIRLSASYGTNSPFEMKLTVPIGFADVKNSDYFAKPVSWAVENQITMGTGANSFSPNATCTTAQILTFLWRSQGGPEVMIENPFTDISKDDYYYKAALWANEKGLVSGSTFRGSTPCTRAATVTYLWMLAGKPSAPAATFTDVPITADYLQAVSWAVGQGITTGTSPTTFSPEATCTRGQIVTFLYRAYGK